jgi:hypothetical protein
MIHRLLRHSGLVALCLAFTAGAATAHPTSHFVVLLTSSADGFEMRCAEGCAAPDGFFRLGCGVGQLCRGELFDQGVRGVAPDGAAVDEPLPPGAKFAFLVTRKAKGKGLELRSKSGCAWKTLWFDCGGSGACSVRVDERGIRKALPEEMAR